jgi:hypothetical protein
MNTRIRKTSKNVSTSTATNAHVSASASTSTFTVVTHFQALASDNLVMLNIWTKNGIPDSWLKRNFLGWSFAWLDEKGQRNPLRSWIPFEGQTNADWQPASHDVRPVQGSSWFH